METLKICNNALQLRPEIRSDSLRAGCMQLHSLGELNECEFCRRANVSRVGDGEQSLLVLLPHGEHLRRPSRKKGRAHTKGWHLKERAALWECLYVSGSQVTFLQTSCQMRPSMHMQLSHTRESSLKKHPHLPYASAEFQPTYVDDHFTHSHLLMMDGCMKCGN